MTLQEKIKRAIIRGAVLSTAAGASVACDAPPKSETPATPVAPKPPVVVAPETPPVPVAPEAVQEPKAADGALIATPEEINAALAVPPPPPPIPTCATGVRRGYDKKMLRVGGKYMTCRAADARACTSDSFSAKRGKLVCGPFVASKECCAVFKLPKKKPPIKKPDPKVHFPDRDPFVNDNPRHHNRGRPFIVDGEMRRGNVVGTATWCDDVAFDVSGLSATARRELAAGWAKAGTEEHAAIASFSRFLLDLLSLGAPAELVLATTRAIDDEVRHTKACFAIASVFAGERLGPGAIAMNAEEDEVRDEATILRDVIAEGCIGETIAAVAAEWLVPQAKDPAIAETLKTIANDEGYHAGLAWEFVAWLLRERPHLRSVAAEAFALDGLGEELPGASEAVALQEGQDLGGGFGLVPTAAEPGLAALAMRSVVAPCAAALFEAA